MMNDPNRALQALAAGDMRCVDNCKRILPSDNDKVKFYNCGHVILQSCYKTKNPRPHFCPACHPLIQMDFYNIPIHDEYGRIEFGIPAPTYEVGSGSGSGHQHPQDGMPQAIPINASEYSEMYKTTWNPASWKDICRSCGSAFSVEERPDVVYHMATHGIYHTNCAREMCAQAQNAYSLGDFLAKGDVLLQ